MSYIFPFLDNNLIDSHFTIPDDRVMVILFGMTSYFSCQRKITLFLGGLILSEAPIEKAITILPFLFTKGYILLIS